MYKILDKITQKPKNITQNPKTPKPQNPMRESNREENKYGGRKKRRESLERHAFVMKCLNTKEQ